MGLDIYFHKAKRTDYDAYTEAHKKWAKEKPASAKMSEKSFNALSADKQEKIRKEVTAYYKKEPTMEQHNISDVGYFRKVNFLIPFFSYSENCEFKEIAKSELEDLKERTDKLSAIKPVRKVKHWYREEDKSKPNPVENKDYWVENIYRKADKELAEDLLPSQSGFFFGSTEYNQWYWQDVKEVNEWVTDLLENLKDDEMVLMYCWW